MKYIGWLEDDETLCSAKEIVTYGAGVYGRRVYNLLKEKGWHKNVKAFCVTDEKVARDTAYVCDIKVISVKEAVQTYPDADYIIAGTAFKSMTKTLVEYGFKENIHLVKI